MMPRHHLPVLPSAMSRHLIIAFVLVACHDNKAEPGAGSGGGPSNAKSDGPIDTCALITKAEIEPILGGTIGNGERGKTSEYCRFTVKGPLKTGEKSSIGDEGGYLDVNWNEHWTPVKEATKMMMMPVTTLGVDAWYNQFAIALEVSYRGGSLQLQLTTYFDKPDNDGKGLAPLTSLAKIALAHH